MPNTPDTVVGQLDGKLIVAIDAIRTELHEHDGGRPECTLCRVFDHINAAYGEAIGEPVNQALDTADEGMVERVARAIDPDGWTRRDHFLKFKQEPPDGIDRHRHEESCDRLASNAVALSLEQARAAIEATGVSTLLARVERLRGALRAITAGNVAPGSRYNVRLAREFERIRETARKAIEVSLP